MTPVANVSMLIRAPAADVFNAFVEPSMLTRFWLARASEPLAAGRSVTWEFMVPGAIAETHVQDMTPNRRIVLEWGEDESAELKFEQRADGFTQVEIASAITCKTAGEAVAKAIEATQGYTLVVSNLKALLETGRSAGLVEDKAVLITEKQGREQERQP
jgi:uncharacterized protein YndB with AHSA1/START domain